MIVAVIIQIDLIYDNLRADGHYRSGTLQPYYHCSFKNPCMGPKALNDFVSDIALSMARNYGHH